MSKKILCALILTAGMCWTPRVGMAQTSIVNGSQMDSDGSIQCPMLNKSNPEGGAGQAKEVISCSGSAGNSLLLRFESWPVGLGDKNAEPCENHAEYIVSGDRYVQEVDLPALPGVLGLELVRHYSSHDVKDDKPPGVLGQGWKLSYETKLTVAGERLQILQADGIPLSFYRDPHEPGHYRTTKLQYGQIIVRNTAKGEKYIWVWTHGKSAGRRLIFNQQGLLIRIEAPSGETVKLDYDAHDRLQRVTDPRGRYLQLNHSDRSESDAKKNFDQVQSIDTPVGQFRYDYKMIPENMPHQKGANHFHLMRVEFLSFDTTFGLLQKYSSWERAEKKISRIYHYEDKRNLGLLTGISVAEQGDGNDRSSVFRISSFDYNENGSVISGRPGHFEYLRTDLSQQSGSPDKPSRRGKDQRPLSEHPNPEPSLRNKDEGYIDCHQNNRCYHYRSDGAMTDVVELDAQNRVRSGLRWEYDIWGRVTRISRVDYAAGETRARDHAGKLWPAAISYSSSGTAAPSGAKSGNPAPDISSESSAQVAGPFLNKALHWPIFADEKAAGVKLDWLVRYQYKKPVKNSDGLLLAPERPILIARPSVVIGKEYQLRIDYNEAGQPLTITESGFRPSLPLPEDWLPSFGPGDGSVDHLEKEQAAHPSLQQTDEGRMSHLLDFTATEPALMQTEPVLLQRTTNYRYEQINGHSVLVEIDGPLPNGPANSPRDSDMTHYRWDAQGNYVTQITLPGERVISIAKRTHIGLPTRIVYPDGVKVQYDYEPHGKLIRITRAGRIVNIAYDFRDRAIQWDGNDGQIIRAFYYDSYIGYLFPDGNVMCVNRNADAGMSRVGWINVLGSVLTEPHLPVYDQMRKSFVHSSALPLDSMTKNRSETSNGNEIAVQVKRNDFNPVDFLLSVNDGGMTYTLERGNWGHVSVLTLPDGGRHMRVSDDFGRIVYLEKPDKNGTYWSYDLADRPVRMQNILREMLIKYDTSGRIWTRDHSDRNGVRQTVDYHYRDDRLERIEAGQQTTEYEYDKNGRIIKEKVILNTDSGTVNTYTTNTSYDELGRPFVIELPEGALLYYQYDRSGRLQRIDYQHSPHSWWIKLMRWFWADQGKEPLVSEIEVQRAFGATAFKYSNGEYAQAFYDRNGRLQLWRSGALRDSLVYNDRGEMVQRIRNELQVRRYAYDDWGRLTGISGNWDPTPMIRLQLDSAGNRLKDTRYKYNYSYRKGLNYLLSLEGDKQSLDYTYNQLGEPEMIKGWKGGSARTPFRQNLLYGARGELLEIHENRQLLVRYGYNHLRQRVSKQIDGMNIQYLWSNGLLSAEASDGTIYCRYIFLGNRPVTLIRYDNKGDHHIYAIHTNYLGTVQIVNNALQQPVWQVETSIYGRMLRMQQSPSPEGNDQPGDIGSGNFEFNLRLPGHYADWETGYAFDGYRYYDPEIGRYLTPDPIDVYGGSNHYLYGNNRPSFYFGPQNSNNLFSNDIMPMLNALRPDSAGYGADNSVGMLEDIFTVPAVRPYGSDSRFYNDDNQCEQISCLSADCMPSDFSGTFVFEMADIQRRQSKSFFPIGAPALSPESGMGIGLVSLCNKLLGAA